MSESETFKPDPEHVEIHFFYRKWLPMWTIYRPTTTDYPGKWLARMFFTLPESKPTSVLIVGDSLEEVRARLPPGLFNLNRDENDDPVIEETWI